MADDQQSPSVTIDADGKASVPSMQYPGLGGLPAPPSEAQPAPQQPAQVDPYSIYQQQEQRADVLAGDLDSIRKRQQAILNRGLPRAAPPNLQNAPPPPKLEAQNVFRQPAAALTTFMLLGSGLIKGHARDAMTAAGEFMKGFDAGDQQRMQIAQDNWNNSLKAIKENNDNELERYNAILNNNKITQIERQAQLEALAVEKDDKIKLNELHAGNLNHFVDLVRLQGRANAQITKGIPKPEQVALQRFLQEHPQASAEEIQKFVQSFKQPRSAPGMAVAKFLEQNPGATAEDIQKFVAQGSGASAAARTAATTGTNLELIIRNAYAALPRALEMSEKVPRGSFVPLNKLFQTAASSISDTNLKLFRQTNLQLAELWARAMNPRGVMRLEDRNLALSILSTADSKETYRAAVGELRRFLEREQRSVQRFQAGQPMEEGAEPPSIVGDAPVDLSGGQPAPSPGWSVVR